MDPVVQMEAVLSGCVGRAVALGALVCVACAAALLAVALGGKVSEWVAFVAQRR